MAYTNDVFISYSREDVAWASQLEKDLQAHGKKLSIFRDQTRITAGDDWEEKLLADLKNSQHLAMIWSDKAKTSTWVHAEIASFRAHAGQANDRKILCMLLQGTNPVLSRIQMLEELKLKNAYGQDPQNLPPDLQAVWTAEVERLHEAIKKNDRRIPIPCTVLAMTQAEAATLTGMEDMAHMAPWSLNAALTKLAPFGLGTLAQLQGRYGPQRLDWKPFLGAASIASVLEQLIKQINKLPSLPVNVEFKWEWVEFLTFDKISTRAALGQLLGELAVVVLDPLSLYHPDIGRWVPWLAPCFERDNVIIMTLTPFDLPSMQADLRELVRGALGPMFDFYYDPPVPLNRRIPLCGLNLGDNLDMQRIVQFRIGNDPRVGCVQVAHPDISMGKGSI